MHSLQYSVYQFCLRIVGLVALFTGGACGYLGVLRYADGNLDAHFVVSAVVSLALGFKCALPGQTPQWLSDPTGLLQGLGAMAVSTALFLTLGRALFSIFDAWAATYGENTQIGEIIFLQIYLVALLCPVMALSGFFNCFFPRMHGEKRRAKSVQVAPEVKQATSEELRNLRHSRMNK